MCGRFALHRQRQEIRDRAGYDLDIGEWVDEEQFQPRYNVAPRTMAPVIRRRNDGFGPDSSGSNASGSTSSNSDFIMQSMKWGLVPHWSKHEDKTLSTTNARSENLVEGGGMWASIKGKRRCAIVCDGYYEWLTKGKDKLPHYTKHKDGKLMLLAGLYDCAHLEGEKEPLWTFTIVTTAANKEFEWLHDRQPVILSSQAALEKWLDTSSKNWSTDLTQMVQPYKDTASPLECYQVPKEVGKVGTESPTFVVPVAQRKDGIQAMFSKQKAKQEQEGSPGKRKRDTTPPASQEDDEIQIVEHVRPSKKVKHSPQKLKGSQTKGSSKSKAKGQITSFFAAK